jgi:hypothetical protein
MNVLLPGQPDQGVAEWIPVPREVRGLAVSKYWDKCASAAGLEGYHQRSNNK